jgi:hypothetical protein
MEFKYMHIFHYRNGLKLTEIGTTGKVKGSNNINQSFRIKIETPCKSTVRKLTLKSEKKRKKKILTLRKSLRQQHFRCLMIGSWDTRKGRDAFDGTNHHHHGNMKVSDTLPHFIYISFLRCAIIGIDCC